MSNHYSGRFLTDIEVVGTALTEGTGVWSVRTVTCRRCGRFVFPFSNQGVVLISYFIIIPTPLALRLAGPSYCLLYRKTAPSQAG